MNRTGKRIIDRTVIIENIPGAVFHDGGWNSPLSKNPRRAGRGSAC
jgi:hypothetical protein